jgi:CRISPR-associated protein Csb2
VARFILAGRPRPLITDAVKIGETFRRALMSCARGPVPAALSGRDDAGAPLRDPLHAHAFFLPEDQDEDGFIDHLVLFARPGLTAPVREAAQRLQRLWIDKRPRGPEDDAEDGREEWRLALEGFGAPQEFEDCALLRASRTWISATPYLRPRHLKGDDPTEETFLMVRTECERRGWPTPVVQIERGGGIRVSGADRSVLTFHRFRSRRGLVQPDRTGLSLRLTFSEPVLGPIALGFGAHYGLGLFRAAAG